MKLPSFLKRKQPKEEASVLGGAGFAADFDLVKNLQGLYTGATVPGSMSLPRPWKLDYYALRERAWQSYTENEASAAIIDRFVHLVVSTGLRVQFEPWADVSDSKQKAVEKYLSFYSDQDFVSLTKQKDMHSMAAEAYLNACNAGDMLVVLHVEGDQISIQHIDGMYVRTPTTDTSLLKAVRSKGGDISYGVEFDKQGREVAYHVRQTSYLSAETTLCTPEIKFERIPAFGKGSGRRVAFLLKRDNQRVGGARGKPVLSPVLQNLEIIRRYKLADLMAAEVNALFAMQIEHTEFSSGLNPLGESPHGGGRHTTGQAPDMFASRGPSASSGDEIAGRVTAATPATVVNMGKGQKLSAVDSKRPNVDGAKFVAESMVDISAAVGIPDEVTKMKFTASYSAARGALEMFKLVCVYERNFIAKNYYSRIYKEVQRLKTLQGKLKISPVYLNAIIAKDQETMALYEKYRYTGVSIPEIDRLKAAKAAKELIDARLTTHTRETEALGTGDFEKNVERLEREYNLLDEKELLPKSDDEIETEGVENATQDKEIAGKKPKEEPEE